MVYSVIIPTYNEAESILEVDFLFRQLVKVIPDCLEPVARLEGKGTHPDPLMICRPLAYLRFIYFFYIRIIDSDA